MRSKWEYIRDACRKLGYEEAAGIADEIEILLKEIYGDTKTIAWMRDYIGVKEKEPDYANIREFAGESIYCIGCMEEVDCEECKFKKRTQCEFGKDSLYGSFFKALDREAELR